MLEPRKAKWRKHHRGRRRGMAARGNYVAFGSYGLKALEAGWITARQIESARVAIVRKIRKHGRMWIRIFPDKSVTRKPAEVRMGKGKGAPDHWVAVVKPGRILFEVEGLDRDLAAEAFRLAGFKLPVKTKLVGRREHGH
ncbi:MAG: 50S ribosomal protein L16 [Fidelibacterota bacterium]